MVGAYATLSSRAHSSAVVGLPSGVTSSSAPNSSSRATSNLVINDRHRRLLESRPMQLVARRALLLLEQHGQRPRGEARLAVEVERRLEEERLVVEPAARRLARVVPQEVREGGAAFVPARDVVERGVQPVRRVIPVDAQHHPPFSSKNSSVGVNWTLRKAANAFSVMTLPSIQVTSRSPQMLMATALKCRRVLSARSFWLKLTRISSRQ